MSTIKINTCDKEWFGKDYVFYDNSGNPININYDSELDLYQGKQYFPENSSDTFKELELNIFERIRGFEYQQYTVGTNSTTNELMTRKFQLFNTEGMSFISNTKSVQVKKISSVNNDINYNSKWIYGDDIDSMFPYGTEVKLNRQAFSIGSDETYTVVGSKQDSIMIITSDDNKSFVDNYGGTINDESNYTDLFIGGVNAIKLHNYIDDNYRNVFPDWSEPNFYNQIFKNQKLTVLNTKNNDGVYTIKNKSLGDNYYSNFKILIDDFKGDMTIKLVNKTSNFRVYSGDIILNSTDNVLELPNGTIPYILKPNTDFTIPLSIDNNIILTTENVPLFNNQTTTYYSEGNNTNRPDQVLYNNRIYECIKGYTQSAVSSTKEKFGLSTGRVYRWSDNDDGTVNVPITPDNKDYWKLSNFAHIRQTLTNEVLNNSDIFLNNNQINLKYVYDDSLSNRVNLAKCFESYARDFNSVGMTGYIDPLGYYGIIKSNYPTEYIEVEYLVKVVDVFGGLSGNTQITNGSIFSPTGYKFSYKPHETTTISVTLDNNYIPISKDASSSTALMYFSDNGGLSSLDFNKLNKGTELYWKSMNANYEIYESNVVKVEYITEVSIKENIIERIIEIEEELNNEYSDNISERFERLVAITDIDEYGLVVNINEQIYDIESTMVRRNNGEIDLEESIDITIKRWVDRWRLDLDKLGIFITSDNFGLNNTTSLHNCIIIQGVYPNVEIDVNVKVGDTADFHFPDKYVTFHKLGGTSSVLSIKLNGKTYTTPFEVSIETTLSNWAKKYKEQLNNDGIYVETINQSLYFTKYKNVNISIDINVGKTFYPGEKVIEITEYWKGNIGTLITSNSIVQYNNDISFKDECFSTGHIISINNSDWTLNNQEYNIQYLDSNLMTLSYQGPFWGTIDNLVTSAFFNLAFGDDLEIGDPIIAIIDGVSTPGTVVDISHNQYGVLHGTNKIAIVERQNAWYYDPSATYSNFTPDQTDVKYTNVATNISDIEYYNSIYKMNILDGDNLSFIDPSDLRIRSVQGLSGSVIKQVSNPINNLLYVLTSSHIYVVDPMTEEVKSERVILDIPSIFTEGFDMVCDTVRGDVYISTKSDRIIKISTSFDIPSNDIPSKDYVPNSICGRLTYSRDDDAIYVFSRNDLSNDKIIYRINPKTNEKDDSFGISNIGIGLDDNYLGSSSLNEKGGKIHYNEFNGDLHIVLNGSLHKIDTTNNTLIDLGIDTSVYYSIAYDLSNKCMWISNSSEGMIQITEDGNINRYNMSEYGYLLYNPVDSNIYISSHDDSSSTYENLVYVYSTFYNEIFHTFELDFELNKMIYNRHSMSIIGTSHTNPSVAIIPTAFIYNGYYKTYSNVFNLSSNRISEKFTGDDSNVRYGTLAEDYEEVPFMYIKTRDFIRKPRKNYLTSGAPQITWEITWKRDDVDEIFIFDTTGDHLPSGSSYSYIGKKPLSNPTLRRVPNTDLNLITEDYAQQTVFPSLEYVLDYNDSETNISFIPEGIQTFFGFNSKDEGVVHNQLQVIERETLKLEYPTYESFESTTFSTTLPEQHMSFSHNEETGFVEIVLSENSTDTFSEFIDLSTFIKTNTNLREGQVINIKIKDHSKTNKYVSFNDNISLKIYKVFTRKLVLLYLDNNRKIKTESTKDNSHPLSIIIDVLPREVILIDFYGQTEIEDIRYSIELSNTGNVVNPEDIFVFKEYDINEGGMDWSFLNRKRKEMLMVRNDIFNYIGSYKSIINSINYFGYNDLELYEYFININEESSNYQKLSKIEIVDIFDNSVEGWKKNYKEHHYPNANYDGTNLFNLSYRLTDFDGNHRQTYSLEDAIIKLSGLKKWLEKNIIPITHKILDITGRLDFKDTHQIYHTPSSMISYKMNDYITPVDFNIREIYVLPIHSGSNVCNAVIDFGMRSSDSEVDYFNLNIKTYKIYEEWDVFKGYEYSDKVIYYGKIYENVLLDDTPTAVNKMAIKSTNNNPREYDNIETWSVNIDYVEGDIVEYNRRHYKYSHRTGNVNYLPWIGASGSCISGVPSTTSGIFDNFYSDLLDRIGNEEDVPKYWIDNKYDNNNFDTLDIIKENYPNDWCKILSGDADIIESIMIDLINTPSEQFVGDKPATKTDARRMIDALVETYTLIKGRYKLKFDKLSPLENLLLDNPDFIIWDDITKWIEIDLEPVQTINEYRSGVDMLLPFNLTIDSDIDPYIVIQTTSSNGYGQIKHITKSYETKFDADSDSVLIKYIR